MNGIQERGRERKRTEAGYATNGGQESGIRGAERVRRQLAPRAEL